MLRVPDILEALRAFPRPIVDRAVVERLFGVGRRRAILLLHSWGGFESGKALFMNRHDLIGELERLLDGDEYKEEHRRRTRLAEDLTVSREMMPGRKVRIADAEKVRGKRLEGMSPSIHLKPGELLIEFSGAEDLLGRLYELSQAILNDYARFEQLIDG